MPSQHKLRETINALPIDDLIPQNLLAKHDAPVLASTLKLWLLELEAPICMWDGWDEIRSMYPSGTFRSRLNMIVSLILLLSSWCRFIFRSQHRRRCPYCLEPATYGSSPGPGCARQTLKRVRADALIDLSVPNTSMVRLTEKTEVETEPADVYRNKLALSLGRGGFLRVYVANHDINFLHQAILRPRIETHLSVQDKHPTGGQAFPLFSLKLMRLS